MNDPREPIAGDVARPRKNRSWVALVGLVLLAAIFSGAITPAILLAVPFGLLAVALPPRRPPVIVAGVVLLVLLLSSAAGGDSLWYFERGWSILLGSWFVVMVIAMPAASFVSRALATLGASVATSAVFLALNRGGFARLDGAVSGKLKDGAKAATDAFAQMMPNADTQAAKDLPANMVKMAELQVMLFPALLSIASVAALGAGWWMFRKLAASDEQPLRPVREFRFSDHLVWMLVVGALLVLVSDHALANRVGMNLVVFMAALYALRGLAVLLVVGRAPGPFGKIMGAIAVLYLFPIVMAATMIVGLTDTWLDIRAKRPIAPSPGS